MKKQWSGIIMLLLAAMIWGGGFVSQTEGMKYAEPFTFQGTRFLIGSLVLLPVIAVRDRMGNADRPKTKAQKKHHWISGLICGLILFAACTPQQLGLKLQLPAGKSGFITSLYIILVPIFGIFLRKKVRPTIWLSVALAVFGLYMLCGMGTFSMNLGEGLTLLCAVAFSFHIMYIDHVSPGSDGVRLSCIQFFTAGSISLIIALCFEQPSIEMLQSCMIPILYSGVCSSGIAYTLQMLAQSKTEPTTASLLMSLESVFSALFGWLIIGQKLSALELGGCALVFVGVVIAQLPEKEKQLT